jgi:predicted DNA-binding protein with PD1-like motif
VPEASGYALLSTGRVYFLKVPSGSSPHAAVEGLLEAQGVRAAAIHGIGGFRWARLGVFSPEEGRYHTMDVEALEGRVLEVLSIAGNSVLGPDGAYHTHLHAVVARGPGEVYGGHLVDARVEPFLELVVQELVGDVERVRELLSHRWAGSR